MQLELGYREADQPAPRRAIDSTEPMMEVMAAAPPASLPPGHVETGQAANFERLFKEALRPELRKQARELAHTWLQKHRIVDSRGNPTAKAILKDDFYQTRERAIAYAESL